MQVSHNYSLKTHNTFGFDVLAEHFTRSANVAELQRALAWAKSRQLPVFILGAGSNSVFTADVAGLVIQMDFRQLEFLAPNRTGAAVIAGAGVDWHWLVQQCLQKQRYGLENLALIPGSAGAAPIQNIGAYGRELSDFLTAVEILDRTTGDVRLLNHEQCLLGYRDSLFKSDQGRDLIVLAIHLNLAVQDKPLCHYASLAQSLDSAGIDNPDSQTVFEHVCAIRRQKLPDPAEIGNAGSFFKNPVVSADQLKSLLSNHPEAPHYPQHDGCHKIAAGWLIEKAGWKGYRRDRVGVHADQALVLVNHGGGSGQQIATLAADIQRDIEQKFHITLEAEPGIY